MASPSNQHDVILIGAGVMSATLGTLLKQLDPTKSIVMFESLDRPGEESSNEWNNAGTGHAALCELNYTPARADGSVDVSKAVKINEQFQESLQYWAHLVEAGVLPDAKSFIRSIPHMSWVTGEDNVNYLRTRYEALREHPLFAGMEYSDDAAKLATWIPLMMQDRADGGEPVAVTYIASGTDVNFGEMTRQLVAKLAQGGTAVHYRHKVVNVQRARDGKRWRVTVQQGDSGERSVHEAAFVFIGSGGASLHLLQKSGIEEGRHIGGFPVSGLFLVCNKPELAEQHHAKVYGKAKVGAPPMSVPHLDTRYIDGKKSLLFGPFAGFTPKFLKNGSNLDLFASIKPSNLLTMLASGVKNVPLTKYLVEQVLLSKDERVAELREFMPSARAEDWDLVVAGQRVQVIKDTATERGVLQFGTEVITAADGSIAALLGASPGASTAVSIMLELLSRCFKDELPNWQAQLTRMVPSYGKSLSSDTQLLATVKQSTNKVLGLQ